MKHNNDKLSRKKGIIKGAAHWGGIRGFLETKRGKIIAAIVTVAVVILLIAAYMVIFGRSDSDNNGQPTPEEAAQLLQDEFKKSSAEQENLPETPEQQLEAAKKQIDANTKAANNDELTPTNLPLYINGATLAKSLGKTGEQQEFARKGLATIAKMDSESQQQLGQSKTLLESLD